MKWVLYRLFFAEYSHLLVHFQSHSYPVIPEYLVAYLQLQ